MSSLEQGEHISSLAGYWIMLFCVPILMTLILSLLYVGINRLFKREKTVLISYVIVWACFLFMLPTVAITAQHVRTDTIMRHAMSRCIDKLRLENTSASKKKLRAQCPHFSSSFRTSPKDAIRNPVLSFAGSRINAKRFPG